MQHKLNLQEVHLLIDKYLWKNIAKDDSMWLGRQIRILYKNKESTIAQQICLRQPSCNSGFESRAHHLWFLNFRVKFYTILFFALTV